MKLHIQKRTQAILYFANKSTNKRIKRLKLVKLLWLADRIHLNRYGRMILKDDYYALPHGPVPSKTMDQSKLSIPNVYNVNGFNLEAEDDFDLKYFSESDLEVMEEVWNKFGKMTEFKLRDYSHLFPEWKRFEDRLKGKKQQSYKIRINDFFEAPDEKADLKIDKEQINTSKEYFNHRNSIQEILE